MKKRRNVTVLLASVLILGIGLTISTPARVAAHTKINSNPHSRLDEITIDDVFTLIGMTDERIVVADGGVLILLGGCSQDVVVEPGGAAYVYGLVIGNVLNLGGYVEIYGVVGGYAYTESSGDTQIDPDAIVVATPPAVTPTPRPTLPPSTPTTPTPSPTPQPSTPTPPPTPTPSPAAGTIDLSMSLYKSAITTAEREPYEEILAYFADAIYEMSNGAHKVRNVTIYENGAYATKADVVWSNQEWPCAYINGYGVSRHSVYMGDLFNATNFLSDMRCGGYVLAHEWGHYYYGLYDEYQSSPENPCDSYDLGCPRPDDEPVLNSVMNNTWLACKQNDFDWLNFSISKNQTGRNAQYRVYNASAWETLIRPTSQDPRSAARMAVRERTYYSELMTIAPSGNSDASIELLTADAETQARSELDIVWANDATAAPHALAAILALASASTDVPYQGVIESVMGNEVEYPYPVILVAQAIRQVPISKADVRAGVRTPEGTIIKLTLKDDGVAPDVLANDGLYSGFMTYTQEGQYDVFVTFNNLVGTAEFTEESLEHSTGPNGETDYPEPQPVGENFYAVANTAIIASNVLDDDHGNTTTDATTLFLDNVNVTGRIDYADDVDMFEVTSLAKGKMTLRVSNMAFDMQPKIRILRADGTTIIDEFDIPLEENQYFFTTLKAKAGETFYVAISHLDSRATMGLYDVSIGLALPNDVESPPLNLLFIIVPAAGLLMLALTIFALARRRPAPRKVAPPRRRKSPPSVLRKPARRKPSGSSIYKDVRDKDEGEEDIVE